jgi:hypothetical protein
MDERVGEVVREWEGEGDEDVDGTHVGRWGCVGGGCRLRIELLLELGSR